MNKVLNLLKAVDGIVNFYNVFETQSPRCPFDVIPTAKRAYITRIDDKPPHFKEERNYFKSTFFPSTVIK